MGEPILDAIVFDVGGVLVRHENRLIYAALSARCRPGVSAKDVAARVVDPKIDIGARPVADLQEELVRDLGYAGDREAFLADWCCHFTRDRGMIALARSLAETTRVMLFSNTNREHWEFLTADPASELREFERYLSYEIGVAKPDVAAYDRVARSAGIAPSRSLFLDDRVDNVEGARRAGFQAEVFAGEEWLRGYLEKAGVLAR